MSDRPIIFSGPMVRALLAGRKTQTRRILSPQPETFLVDDAECKVEAVHVQGDALPRVATGLCLTSQKVPYAKGDRLYVREAHRLTACPCTEACRLPGNVYYEAGQNDDPFRYMQNKLRPSIHMPRWASRLTLTVEHVRVERLQAISEDDARAEGPEYAYGEGSSISHRSMFELLWRTLHGPDSWDANPFVVALTFRVEHGNIDRLEGGT